MYGYYTEYETGIGPDGVRFGAPLGIQAVCTAIYEPPQGTSPDGIQLLDDPHGELVDRLAAAVGLKKVSLL